MAVEKQPGGVTLQEAEQNTILRAEAGSTVHGLGVGTDDRDEIGICIEDAEYVIGLRHFEQVVHRTQPEGVRSGPGDLDLTIYGLRKFCSLALKGNPSILLLFNVPDESCTVLTPLGKQLRARAHWFASKKAGAAFLGYMTQQRERLIGARGQMGVKRPELIEAYGYDTKFAGHMIRLGFQGVEYMRTGTFTVPMRDAEREYIRAIRLGEVSESAVLQEALMMEVHLKHLISHTALPDEPNYAEVNTWLVGAYFDHWIVR